MMDTNFSFRHPKKLHLCRLCLLHKDSLVNIHERNVTHGFVIAVEISDLLQLDVYPGDGLPDAICFDCLFDLSRFKRFKRNSHEAEVTLKYILNLREVDTNSSIQTSLTEFKEENSDGYEFQDNDVDSQTGHKLLEENFLSSSASEIIKTEDIHQNQHHEESGGNETELCFNETENLPEEKVRLSKQKKDAMEKLHGMQMERTRLQRKYSNLHTAIKEETFDYDCDEGNYSSKGLDHARMNIVRQDERMLDGDVNNLNPSTVEMISFKTQNVNKCSGCITLISDNCSFRSHISSGMCNSSFKCSVCNESFISRVCLMQHHIRYHTSVRRSDVHQGNFAQQNEVFGGIVNHLENQSCPLNENENHQRNCSKGMQVSINEDGCQGNHVQDCNVNSHSLTILMKRGFICDKCGSCFKKKIIFERHLMKYHSQKLSFSCGICCKTFLTKGGLKEHLVVHSTERPFMCDICGSTFKLRKKLLRHIRTCHSGNS